MLKQVVHILTLYFKRLISIHDKYAVIYKWFRIGWEVSEAQPSG
jgi:hypothetical protein